jgi:processive 1,2-diacylglycerol beta-glucosyltransferase
VRISVTGIPIHPLFSQPKPRDECLRRQGLAGDRPIVLQLAGGFGVGPIEQIYLAVMARAVMAIETPIEVVVVSGRNEELKERLAAIAPPERHRAHVLGFTDQMDELMAVAEVVLSKPGGLTTSEVLARGAVMAIVNPIPGQESRNSDYLLENGAAVKINNIGTLAHKLGPLLADPARLAALSANARRLCRPRAAFDIARRALEWNGSRA